MNMFEDKRLIAFALAVCTIIGIVGVLIKAYILISLAFMGIGLGGSFMLSLMLISIRSHDEHQVTSLSGMVQCIGYLMASIGPILIGYIYQITLNWNIPIFICLFCSVVIMFLSILAGSPKKIVAS